MYKGVVLFLVIALVASWALYENLTILTDEDKIAYEKLFENSEKQTQKIEPNKSESSTPTQISSQRRTGLRKELYFEKGDKRFCYQICSEIADLSFERQKSAFKVIENLTNMRGYLQQELLFQLGNPVQQVLVMDADKASYDYQEELLIAEGVFIKHVLLPTHALPTDSFGSELTPLQVDYTASAAQMRVKLLDDLSLNAKKALLTIFKGAQDVQMESDQMDFKFAEKSKTPELSEVLAQGHVVINYSDYSAYCDKATFTPITPIIDGKDSSSLQGLITLYSSATERCKLVSKTLDSIDSKEIRIDTLKEEITMQDPKGDLAQKNLGPTNLGQEGKNLPLKFSAGSLLWDDPHHTITLLKDVRINQGDDFKLTAKDQLTITRKLEQGKWELKTFDTAGAVMLTCKAPGEKKSINSLKTQGPLRLNHEKMEARAFGVIDEEGKVHEDAQVLFRDDRGDIYADRALVKYGYVDGQYVTKKIVMLGNVRIINQPLSSSEGTMPVFQHLLAERVEYYPETNELAMMSSGGKRVLFYDQTNNLQVSAPSLKVARDRSTKKDAITGQGDVRFRFIETEFDEIRRKFLLNHFDHAL